jgi:hypothetical protein
MKVSIMTALACAVLLLSPGCKDKESDSKVDEKEVPAIVKDSFSVNYPGAADVAWEMAHEGNEDTYKAKFTNNGKHWKAEFRENGSKIKDKEDD